MPRKRVCFLLKRVFCRANRSPQQNLIIFGMALEQLAVQERVTKLMRNRERLTTRMLFLAHIDYATLQLVESRDIGMLWAKVGKLNLNAIATRDLNGRDRWLRYDNLGRAA
jgi:hypothetical protein